MNNKWILTNKQMPPKGKWVLTTTGDYQKTCEIKCYMGVKTETIYRYLNGKSEEYEHEYYAWTSGHGDISGRNPVAWMLLPDIPEDIEKLSEEWYYNHNIE